MSSAPRSTDNLLLNALEPADRDRLLAQMTRVDLHREKVLAAEGRSVDTFHFLEAGIASVVAARDHAQTEVGIVGREGMTDVGTLLGAERASFRTYVQVDGGTALTIGTAALRAEMEVSAGVRRTLLAFARCFLTQVSGAVVSCAEHMMEARLARWLLMCHDRVAGEQIPLTHEFMATMIAARRSGVTITLHSLEGAGLIRSTRGLVTILDRAKLEELAGDSYGQPEAEYRNLIAPFGRQATGEAG